MSRRKGDHESAYNRLDGVRVHFWRRAARHFSSQLFARTSFGCRSKDIVKLGMGLVATMAALVLGLLVASAKGSYDAQSAELTRMSASIALLDRVLAGYGPETKDARELLRGAAGRILNQMWSEDGTPEAPPSAGGEILYDKVAGLQGHALSITIDVGKARWLMYAQAAASVSMPLLVVLVIWLTVIFISFGLFAPFNATVVAILLISALSVSGAIFLILEMYGPYAGVIQISSAPLRAALAHLGQ